jgi:branched-chain amino acid transport system permease protein
MLNSIGNIAWTVRQSSLRTQIGILLVWMSLVALLPFTVNDYWVRVGAFVLVNIGLASSWNVIGGFAGYASFGHGVFFGIGAFVGAVGIVRYGLPLPIVMALGGLVAGVVAFLLTPIFKQRGLYFALSTLAVLLVFENVLQRWTFTRGLRSFDVGWSVQLPYHLWTFYYIFLATVTVLIASVLWLAKSRIGFALHALRKDETLASSMGIRVLKYKSIAFVFSAAWPGILGAAFAPFLTFVSVESVLDLKFTLNMILATIFGGAGTVVGPVIGAVALSGIDQFTWGNFLEYHRLIYGALIVTIITFAPGGLTSIFWSTVRRERGNTAVATPEADKRDSRELEAR